MQINCVPIPATLNDSTATTASIDEIPGTKKKRRRRTKAVMMEFRRMQFESNQNHNPAEAATAPPLPETPVTPLPMMPGTPDESTVMKPPSSILPLDVTSSFATPPVTK